MTKNTLSSSFACFCNPKRCMRVHCLVLKNNPDWHESFFEDDIQLQIQVPPQLKKMKNYSIIVTFLLVQSDSSKRVSSKHCSQNIVFISGVVFYWCCKEVTLFRVLYIKFTPFENEVFAIYILRVESFKYTGVDPKGIYPLQYLTRRMAYVIIPPHIVKS